LKDISARPSFDDGGRPGTYANGTRGNKIDYVLLSPALFAAVTGGGIFRRGVWGGKHGTLWPHYPEMRFAHEAANSIVMMDQGEIIEEAPPDRFFTAPGHERTQRFLQMVKT
jgi:hypothetical protein